jgi:hypothetical protein
LRFAAIARSIKLIGNLLNRAANRYSVCDNAWFDVVHAD